MSKSLFIIAPIEMNANHMHDMLTFTSFIVGIWSLVCSWSSYGHVVLRMVGILSDSFDHVQYMVSMILRF